MNEYLNASYKRYPSGLLHQGAECLLQKRIADDRGTKYFINVYPYVIKPLGSQTQFEPFTKHQMDLQLNRQSDDETINVSVHDVKSPEHAEKLAEEIWNKLGADYYELNSF